MSQRYEQDLSPQTTALCLGLILAAALSWGLVLIHQPWFASAQYEEANPGLVALEALRGNFYAMYWSDTYGGMPAAWLSALWFKVLGPSMLVWRLSCLSWWLFFLVSLFLLGKEIFDRRIGLTAAGLMALPPASASFFSVMGWTGYVATVPVGTMVLWLVAAACLRDPAPRRYGLRLFLAGVGMGMLVWIHLVGLPYVAAAGIIALWARPRRFLRRGFWAIALGVVLGAGPLIHFHLTTGFSAAGVGATAGGKDWLEILGVLGGGILPQLVGAAPVFLEGAWGYDLSWTMGTGLALGLLTYALLVWLPCLPRALKLAGRPNAALWLLVLFCFLAMAAWLASPRAGDPRPRYLHTLASSLPLLTACALWSLRRWGQGVFIAALGLVIGLHVLGQAGFLTSHRVPVSSGKQEEAVVGFMAKKGLRHFYANYRTALPLTFMSWGRLKGSDYYGCQSAPYLPLVDADTAPAIVTHERLKTPPPWEMRRYLKETLAAEFAEKTLGDYTIFHNIRPPDWGQAPLSPIGWKATASHNSGQAGLAIDGDISARWTPGVRQDKDQWLQVEMPQKTLVAGVKLLPGRWWHDGPVNLEVQGSLDGFAWRTLVRSRGGGMAWLGPHPRLTKGGPAQVVFKPTPVRFLKVRLYAPARRGWRFFWSLAELVVYGPGDRPYGADARTAAALIRVLEDLNPSQVLAPEHLAVNLHLAAQGRLRTQRRYAHANQRAGCGDSAWNRELFRGRLVDLAARPVFVTPPGRVDRVSSLLMSWGYKVRVSSFHGFRLVLIEKDLLRPIPPGPSWQAWGMGKEAKSLFGPKDFRWTPGKPQAIGQRLTIDLGRVQPVAGLVLDNSPYQDDYLRGGRVLASRDGREWQELHAAWGSLQGWWLGETLYAYRAAGLRLVWPQRNMRYIRIELTLPDQVMWWSVSRASPLALVR